MMKAEPVKNLRRKRRPALFSFSQIISEMLSGGLPMLSDIGVGAGSPPMWHSPAHLRRVRHKGKMERVKRRGMGRK